MTVPLGEADVVSGPQDSVDLSSASGADGQQAIAGRSPWQIAWRRLKKDKAAMVGGVVALLLVLLAIFSKLIEKVFDLDPNLTHNGANSVIDPTTQLPFGSFGGITLDHPLGVEPGNGQGRDVLARIIDGSWVSLLVASSATVLSVVIGVVIGIIAGFYGGWVDAALSRIMDIVLAFPLLLFAIAISASLQSKAFGLTGTPLHIAVIVFVIGFFSWPYILFEAALDFLGVGIQEPQASWGGMLSASVELYRYDPLYMLIPGAAIFLTVISFNLLGDGLRDALDPKSNR